MRSSTSHFGCDRCGAKCDDNDTIGLGIVVVSHDCTVYGEGTDYAAGYTAFGDRGKLSAEWCRKCRIETGLLVPLPPQSKAAAVQAPVAKSPKPLSVEDLIRELIREEIENSRSCGPDEGLTCLK